MVAIGQRSVGKAQALQYQLLRKGLLASTVIAGAIFASASAYAQAAAEPEDQAATASEGDIVVTGSLIKNAALVGNAPVSILGQSEIQLRQNKNAEELLRTLPGAVAGIGLAVASGNPGASTVNLRGLGANRNLVLVDGSRIVPFGLSGVVDLNNIPLALIQRTEVLTGGASTTYGADAISGVVNFITRNDFKGVEASAGTGIAEKGDGFSFHADVTAGGNFDDGRGNAVISIGYQKSNIVERGERAISQNVVDSITGSSTGSGQTVPSRLTIAGTSLGTLQIDPSTGALVPTYSLFNYAPYGMFQAPFKRFNIYGAAHYDVTDNITVYTRAMFSKNTVVTVLAPSGANSLTVAIPYSNPYLPTAARNQICAAVGLSSAQCTAAAAATTTTDPNYRTFTASVLRRATEVGDRLSTFVTNEFDYRAGVKGNITSNIKFDVSASYGESQNDQTITGYTLNSRIRDAALATNTNTCLSGNAGCVPINLFGADGSITPAMAAYITAASSTYVKTSLGQARAEISGDFGVSSPWAANPVNFAVGAEYRKYRASQGADALANSGDLGGLSATANVSGGYSVKEAFGELIAPLVEDVPGIKSLNVNGGIRYSSYSIDTSGGSSFNTTTWKAGGDWSPLDGVKFRGMYQHAVRAPNIGELFTPVTIGQAALARDACAGTAPTTDANLRAVCLAQGAPASAIGTISQPTGGLVNSSSGGNPNLRPETSNSYTLGLVLQPRELIPGFSATLDYYHINVSGAVSSASASEIYGSCFDNITAASATSTVCTQIRRSAITGLLNGDGVAGIPRQVSNLGSYRTNGIDFGAAYRHDFGIFVLNASFDGNYTMHFKSRSTPASYEHECAGYFGSTCGGVDGSIQPKWSWNQRTTFSFDNIDLSLLWRHLGEVNQEPYDIANGRKAYGDFGNIGAYDYFDLSVRASIGEQFELTFTVSNLADKKPPLTGGNIGQTSFNTGNTYPSTYDAIGRRFNVAAKVKF